MRQINLVEGKVVAPEGMKVGIGKLPVDAEVFLFFNPEKFDECSSCS